MNFHWLRDINNQKELYMHWNKGKTNLVDYFIKNHSVPTMHQIRTADMCFSPETNNALIDNISCHLFDKPAKHAYLLCLCVREQI